MRLKTREYHLQFVGYIERKGEASSGSAHSAVESVAIGVSSRAALLANRDDGAAGGVSGSVSSDVCGVALLVVIVSINGGSFAAVSGVAGAVVVAVVVFFFCVFFLCAVVLSVVFVRLFSATVVA
jgi:hypothetical protein